MVPSLEICTMGSGEKILENIIRVRVGCVVMWENMKKEGKEIVQERRKVDGFGRVKMKKN